MTMRFPSVRQVFALLITLGLGGCATTEVYEVDKAPEYQVIREYSPFYEISPMQARGPDLSLRTTDRVKLLKKDFTGFAFVQISDGRQGYVGFVDLAPAPPRPPSATTTTTSVAGRSGRRSADSEPIYDGPQVTEVPLPNPGAPLPNLNVGPEEVPAGPSMIDAEPTNDSKPKFRY